ncbi:MAG: electron transfer flavoprotein subunit alpha/FixB family protein [Chloroflexi bacterium]|nr:electron transfer flavoprotein subunit alpha/FixB family protein [Chloroflexota bacterium]
MSDYKGIITCSEIVDGKLASISLELLGAGKKLANELGQQLETILIGNDVSKLANDAISHGASKVYVIEDAALKDYQPELYSSIIVKTLSEVKPYAVLLGQTSMGRDLAPRLAFKLGTGLATDCIDIKIDNNNLLFTRPVFGGNALSSVIINSYPQIATVRAKAMPAAELASGIKGEIVTVKPQIDPSLIKTKVMDRVKEQVVGIKLEDAAVIVCGGRGMGSAAGFEPLKDLAKLLNGAVGATRPPCDNNWAPSSWQIGLTGKIVSPTLYFGIALSGASQHIAGCSGSKNIVAINKDPEAYIFKVAHFGIVGDYKKVLPALTGKAKELLQK